MRRFGGLAIGKRAYFKVVAEALRETILDDFSGRLKFIGMDIQKPT